MNNKGNTDTLNEHLVDVLLKDKRADRRWRNIRFFIGIVIVLSVIMLLSAPSKRGISAAEAAKKPYVALLHLSGPIFPGTKFSTNVVLPELIRAFSDKKAKGVVLVINSPGGSAVQASIIHDKIEQLKQRYNKKVMVVGEDALASGAYLVATAADKIFVNRDTITGSIGVIMNGFGLGGLIEKIGVTRRVFTAGANKDRLDPFLPLKPQDVVKVHDILAVAHQNFINDVKEGRGSHLHGDSKVLFSGDFWLGEEAEKLGLVDGTANLWTVLKTQFNVSHYVDYSKRPTFIQMLLKNVETTLHINFAAEEPLSIKAEASDQYE